MCDKAVQTEPMPKRRRVEERIVVPCFSPQGYFPMTKLMLDCPHVALDIFKKLDRKSLGNCRAVSRGWKDYIENERHYWKLQLLQCKNLHLYDNGDFDSMLSEMFPELVTLIEKQICANETFQNLKMDIYDIY